MGSPDILSLPSQQETSFIEGLFRHTWLYPDNIGADARHLNHDRLKISCIIKIKNEWLFNEYQNTLRKMDNIDLPHLPYPVRTTNFRRKYGSIMNINPRKEALLFHGTKEDNIDNISNFGFSLQLAKAGLYGKMIYFSDSCQKADQYADDINNRKRGELPMILTRVALGKSKLFSSYPYGDRVDSQIGGRAIDNGKRFYEFMIKRDYQCYPQYIIWYTRIKDRHRNLRLHIPRPIRFGGSPHILRHRMVYEDGHLIEEIEL